MFDFLKIKRHSPKVGVTEISPIFVAKKSEDLMVRGSAFYAIWMEEKGLWSTDEYDAIQLIDEQLQSYFNEHKDEMQGTVVVKYLWDTGNGSLDRWIKYCNKQMPDNYHALDESLTFSDAPVNKKDYASKRLSYPLRPCDITAYETLMSKLYSPEERRKIEWAIGSVVTGDSKYIQKFLVLYGSAGTGKSTVLNIIQQLFDGYYTIFDAKALGSNNGTFALETFKNDPLVAIQHDGDLSRIEDNTRLNSLVSHEEMTVNEKYKSTYKNRFRCFLFIGTNKQVKITDSKSGLLRRLIDVRPTGDKLSMQDYTRSTNNIRFELGGIACHCRDVYLENPNLYDDYVPFDMMAGTNDFFNYMEECYLMFKSNDYVTANSAWRLYNEYCDEAKVPYPMQKRVFLQELKSYFKEFHREYKLPSGEVVRRCYLHFDLKKMGIEEEDDGKNETQDDIAIPTFLEFKRQPSTFDEECSQCIAQYATSKGTPVKKWDDVATRLHELNTSELHYVRVPEQHIVIDFDIPDENGEKSLEKNMEAAAKWPPTYAELSKSEKGIHLHYIYSGDVSKLNAIYRDHIEIKVFSGKSSLRRKLTLCNDLDISVISSGLPLRKERKKMIDSNFLHTEEELTNKIRVALNKGYEKMPSTTQNINFIHHILQEAYDSGVHYDVSKLINAVSAFAANSTHQAPYCMKMVGLMHFKSDTPAPAKTDESAPLVFYDVEVFPNLFLVNYKRQGDDKVQRLINPEPAIIENLTKYKLVGFNCRRYDNHILYGRMMGYNNGQLYNLSKRIINGERNAFFGNAYNLSYTDVYDFAASYNKKSLKKFEIELGIHHQELGLPWDEPVPESKWEKVAEYCDNDVIATEKVFDHLSTDWNARRMLADISGMTVNDTTNSITTKLIFGKNRTPQSQFNYRDMGDVSSDDILVDGFDGYTRFNTDNMPVFPGYIYEKGISTYRGIKVGEGGFVYAEPGMYGNVALLDIASMHPSSIIAENLFGDEYTKRFADLKQARIFIKHQEFDKARAVMDGKLAKYLEDESKAWELSQALKTPINSVYGLTSAKFDNAFRDIRNKDNIVAKRGALFMVNLKFEVEKRGYTVAHIKTDSIKIPDATPEIIQFVIDYGKLYGYDFEHECTYEKMCLVNDAVYIAKYATVDSCIELYGESYVNSNKDICAKNKKNPGGWNATGLQFQVPYVFKKLFSKEDVEFSDLYEIKSVSKGDIYIDMNEALPDVTAYEIELDKRKKKRKRLNLDLAQYSEEDLLNAIATGHEYIFVGRVGAFCPVKPGAGGGILYRKNDKGVYNAVGGTKGYRWLESEIVRKLHKESDIDYAYFDDLVTDAIETISKFGDYEWFVSEEPYLGMTMPTF